MSKMSYIPLAFQDHVFSSPDYGVNPTNYHNLTSDTTLIFHDPRSEVSSLMPDRGMPAPQREVRNGAQQRKRIQVACHRCRRRKIKCSGDPGDGTGCENCRQHNDLSSCKFTRVGTTQIYDWSVPDEQPGDIMDANDGTTSSAAALSQTLDFEAIPTRTEAPDSYSHQIDFAAHSQPQMTHRVGQGQPSDAIERTVPPRAAVAASFNSLFYATSAAEIRQMNNVNASHLSEGHYAQACSTRDFPRSTPEFSQMDVVSTPSVFSERQLPALGYRSPGATTGSSNGPSPHSSGQKGSSTLLEGQNNIGTRLSLPLTGRTPMDLNGTVSAESSQMMDVTGCNAAAFASNAASSMPVVSSAYLTMNNTTRPSCPLPPLTMKFPDDLQPRRNGSYGFSDESLRDVCYGQGQATSDSPYMHWSPRPASSDSLDWPPINLGGEFSPPPRRTAPSNNYWEAYDRSESRR